MEKQIVQFKDLGRMDYKSAWDYQERLLQENIRRKSAAYSSAFTVPGSKPEVEYAQAGNGNTGPSTQHYLLFVEHPPVYTLGKSGKAEHILISDEQRRERGIDFF